MINHIKNGTYLSELHNNLADTDGKGMMHSQFVLVLVLKDCSPSKIVRNVVFSILGLFLNNPLICSEKR